jgi:isoleucyl-tRNA synthetase
LAALCAELNIEVRGTAGEWKGKEFEGAQFQHPFLELRVAGVLADYVTLEQGSGIVHTAPGHGADDYRTGQRYGLESYAPQDDEGRFVEGLPEYKGKTVFEANPIVVDILKTRGMLVGETRLTHSYPHCWRCHNPVIFRATEQWFIQMDAGTTTIAAPKDGPLRQSALAEVDRVKWTPAWGHDRMHEMVAERPDWCISRQRFWGVPLIVFSCGACGKRLEDFRALRHVLTFFEKEGADAWYTHSAEELLPPETKCGCGAENWRKESDILDVWFDSGSTHLAVLSERDGTWPADLYLEGPDQFRGWFQSSLLIGVGIRGRAPYRQVMTYGWALDAEGRPMSKSLGNAIYPAEICDKWGADLLRLWVVSQDYSSDVRISAAMMGQLSEAYRKIRNTFRFVLGNLADFDPARDAVADADLEEMDRWMLARAAELVRQCRKWYEAFEFHRVFHAVHDFAAVDLSAFYFDVLKDKLYTFAPRNRSRRSAQTAMYRIAHELLMLVAPILVFTGEEIWSYFPRRAGHPASIHVAMFPEAGELGPGVDADTKQNWEKLLELRRAVLVALEAARNSKKISGSLEAKVVLNGAHPDAALWRRYARSLPALLIVSQVEIATDGGAAPADVSLRIERGAGTKCERCWNYSTHVGESADYPTVCERCVSALTEIERSSSASS